MRLKEIASRPHAREILEIREPAEDQDYSGWGQRIYNKEEIDMIIMQSGLVKKRVFEIPEMSILVSAAKKVNKTADTTNFTANTISDSEELEEDK